MFPLLVVFGGAVKLKVTLLAKQLKARHSDLFHCLPSILELHRVEVSPHPMIPIIGPAKTQFDVAKA